MLKRLLPLLMLCAALSASAQDSNYVRRIVRDLTSAEMYGRGMQHRGDSIAASYIRSELVSLGVRPLEGTTGYYQFFRFRQTTTRPPVVRAGYVSQNVCGYIPGEVDTMLVFTAHYDHLGLFNDTLYPGAHDNASGVAALLDLARELQQHRHRYTVVFLFFGGEEAGLVGSQNFAERPLIAFSRVKLLLNIDLFCGGSEGLMFVNANDRATAPYVDLLQQLNAERHYVAQIGRRNNAPNSDHYYFTHLCPALFVYTLGGPYGGYHNPDDTCEGCGLQHYHAAASLLRVFLEHLEH